MTSTRSKSSSQKYSSSHPQDAEFISLNMVSELLKVQESTMKNFCDVHIQNTNKRIDQLLIWNIQDVKNILQLSQLARPNWWSCEIK